MKQSDCITKISAAFLASQKSMGIALKAAENPHFKSKFADLTSVIEVAQAALHPNGIAFLQPVSFSENQVIVETMLLHESGEWFSDALRIPLVKMDAQAVGSAISYGRRYGLQAFIGIRADDDDGNIATAAAKPSEKPTVQRKSEAPKNDPETAQRERLAKILSYLSPEQKATFGKQMKDLDMPTLKAIPADRLSDVIDFAEGL